MSQTLLQPPGWPRPKGYANGIAATGTLIFVAGQVGWNAREEFDSHDFAALRARGSSERVLVRVGSPIRTRRDRGSS